MKEFPPLDAHIFVCTNEREAGHPRGCCKTKNSEAVLEQFKKEVIKAGFKGRVRAQKAGCLDTCENGPSVVIYPDGTWYGNVQPEDVAEIVDQHLKKHEPVKRLLMPGRSNAYGTK